MVTDRRLQENGGGVGDFRMTRAMAIVLLVAGSLVVVACGAATFLRLRRDDDDDDDNDDNDRDGRGPERTVVDAGTVCITGAGNKPEGPVHCQPVNVDGCVVPPNGTMPNNNNNVGVNFGNGNNNCGKNMTSTDNSKEYHCGNVVGGRVVGGLQRICSNTIGRGGTVPIGASCADGSGSQQDIASGTPIALVPPSRASPTTLLRGAPSTNNNAQQTSYGTTCKPSLQQKMSLSATATAMDQPGQGRIPQSYHSRNPDIIPAPLMSPGTVYNNYNSGEDL